MATYPGGIPNLTNPAGTDYMNGPNLHSVQHSNANDEIEAIATELGSNPKGAFTTVKARLDSVEASLFGFRNYIRNGDGFIRQRGLGPFTGSAIYTVDGWIKGHVGGTHQIDAINESLEALGGINGAPTSIRSTVTGQSAAGDYAYLAQKIEGVRSLSNKTVTVSFVAYANSGTPKIGVEVLQNFGTGGSPSASVFYSPGAVTITNVGAKYSMTFVVPSISGKVLGTGGDDNLQLQLWLSAGTNFASRASNIGIQNSTITVTDVQLEPGPYATPFERLPQQMQLAWNERYLQTLKNADWNGPTLTRPNSAVSNYYGTLPWKVTPRAYIGTTTTITSITQITQGFNRHDRFPSQLIHKPNVRWDTVSAFQAVISAAGVNIILTPTTDDGYANNGAVFPHGMDFYYSSEIQ